MKRTANNRFWTLSGRPLWRDWVAGVVLIGAGFSVYSPQDRATLLLEVALASVGSAILLAAIVHWLLRFRK